MLLLTPYSLTTLLSVAIILVLGICLFWVAIPREVKLRNYRISQRLLAGAYFILAGAGILKVFGDIRPAEQSESKPFILIAASCQALLFTFSIISLINIRFLSSRRILCNVISVSAFSGLLLGILFLLPKYFLPVLYALMGLYLLQLSYYTILFSKEYGNYRRGLDDSSCKSENRRLIWIRKTFVIAACVGSLATASMFVSRSTYITFTAGYTVFYICFAIRFFNYLTRFHRTEPVIISTNNMVENNKAANGWHISGPLEEWVNDKCFIDNNITLNVLARKLNTNTAYLSRYINKQYGQNFRSWIGALRIGESLRMMDENPDIPLVEIAEKAGIQNISTFYRQFTAVTGITPAEYCKSSRNKPEQEKQTV